MVDLRAATFRSNPAYELVVTDRLSGAEREHLTILEPDADLYGLLRPSQDSDLELRAASRDTALLFLTLTTPGRLPAFVEQLAADSLETTISRLVIDGVLELEHHDEFVSGDAAHELLLEPAANAATAQTIKLSHAALRYGQSLPGLPAETLALRLYLFGRRPLTAALRRRLPNEDSVTEALGLATGGRARELLGKAWIEDPRGDGAVPWRMLRHRGAGRNLEQLSGAKLYVSPHPEQVGESIEAVADVLGDCAGVIGFKVARDVGGLCRPDKLVCYFARLDDLQQSVGVLLPRLEGIAAHGVPFTAPIDAEGLLSWGLDPPSDPSQPSTSPGESWRLRVVRLAAELLVAARETRSRTREPWELALDRLRLAGIDPDTWVPSAQVWAA